MQFKLRNTNWDIIRAVSSKRTFRKRLRVAEAVQILFQRRPRQNVDLHNRRELHVPERISRLHRTTGDYAINR